MNNNLRLFLLKNKWTLKTLNNFIIALRKKSYNRNIKLREKLNLLDYKRLSAELPYYPVDLLPDNNLYGTSYVLKMFMGIPKNKILHASIEHGVYFGSYVSQNSLKCYADKIITYGSVRKENIERVSDKKVICVGPYISYSIPLLKQQQFVSLKKDLGKVLLVFPSHSIKNWKSNYDKLYFVNEIENISRNYDTVLCCLYYVDAQNTELVNFYKSYGYKITCAGHKYDLNFLRRLRSIIELSDDTISNSLGTHVGYCFALGKRHRIVYQDVSYKGGNLLEKSIRKKEEQDTLEEDKKKFRNIFGKSFETQNIKEQKKIINSYFGLNLIKTKEELNQLID